ncbi:MAG: pantoate--beta-alanine ligase [Bacteroidia bacterium]|nr:pantoate--beta-alanine ligase [Bacteroidia bacterium]
MKIVHTIAELKAHLDDYKAAGQEIGLVPTMGALHEGHIKLVERCVHENPVCVVSIFVNPTQFNDPNDLKTYPRTPEHDTELLHKAGCKYVFMPSAEEMYPEPDVRTFEFGSLETVMEGEKDFQQLAIIRKMTRDLNYPIQIVSCPIVREKDGLAMSSRNRRLSSDEREKAPKIAELLFKSATFVDVKSISETHSFVCEGLESDPTFRLEYFEIVDGDTLQPINNWEESRHIVGCIAVFCGPVRLIDNILYK